MLGNAAAPERKPVLNEHAAHANHLLGLDRSHSFVLSTFGFTAVAFVTGSLALWAPTFLFRAAVFTGERAPCLAGNCAASDR